ncbi:MAG: DNA polymerase I [Thermoguttaceae bacterium]
MPLLHNKTVFILDAHGILHQLFHALPEMTSPKGEPVGAVFGFARDLISLVSKHKPDYLFCAYDLPGGTFRNELYPKYKENRKEMPETLRPQIAFSRDLLDAFEVPILCKEGFEADDVLATVAAKVENLGGNCVLVTADKDCRQLLTDHVSMYNLRKQEFYTAKELLADWGIRPDQVVDFQSLTGDSTDNVPGVPLIGPKIATELITRYDTLENVLNHAGEISGTKRKQNLLEGREIALLSRELVRLRVDVPLEFEWETGKFSGFDPDKLREIFIRFGFRSLFDKVGNTSIFSKKSDNGAYSGCGTDSDTLFSKQETAASKNQGLRSTAVQTSHAVSQNQESYEAEDITAVFPAKWEAVLVDSSEKFEQFLTELKEQKIFSFDTETTDKKPRFAKLVGMSFCWNEEKAYYLPLRGPLGADLLPADYVLEKLRPIFEDSAIEKIGQNIKYDMIVLRNIGIMLRGVAFDTMLADYLLRTGEQNHNLDYLAHEYLGHKTITYTELVGTGKKQKQIDEVPTESVCDYAAEDALIPWLIKPVLEAKLKRETALYQLFIEWEMPLIEVLADMEFTGITVDRAVLKELSVRFSEKLQTLEHEIYEIAGEEFNIASPKQLQKILFEKFMLPVTKKTKTGPSTDIEVLEELAPLHILPAKIIEYRQAAKLKGTYIDALPEMIHPETHRIHASFNQVVTATGRLSSSDPNLQNIPIRTPEGREIRSAFVAGGKKGDNLFDMSGLTTLLSCDYSQVELRVLAHFSGDENLIKAFASGEDIHASVASEVFGVEISEVDSDMRRQAKAVNFGVIYGQSAFGLAKQLGIPQDQAAAFIDAYFKKYNGIRNYLGEILDFCMSNGYVTTLLGRRRYIAGVRESYKVHQMTMPERTAINTVIQGSAADLMKQAMIRVQNRLKRENFPANMLLQIHDELVFEVSEEDLDQLQKLVVEEMSLGQPLNVPLVVDSESGKHW